MTEDQKRQLAEYLRPYMPQRLINHYGKREQRAAWAAKYWEDPVGWARDNIKWPEGQWLTPYQEEILAAVPREKRVSVRACHGSGKTTIAALITNWFITTRDAAEADWKAPTTAGGERQLKQFLWPEIHKWARRLRFDRMFRDPFSAKTEMMQLTCRLGYGNAFAASCEQPALIEGAHADQMLYVFDESKAIPAAVFDAAEGAFSGAGEEGREAYGLSISTPGPPEGRFWQIQTKKPGFEDWWVKHVEIDEVVEAKRVSWEWVENRKAQWGEESAIYQNRVLGQFADVEAEGCIPISWVEMAMNRAFAASES
jgi:hypothetical protein